MGKINEEEEITNKANSYPFKLLTSIYHDHSEKGLVRGKFLILFIPSIPFKTFYKFPS